MRERTGLGCQRRIAVLLPDLRPGGAERLHVNLAEEWVRRGVAVDFVLMRARGELLSQLPSRAQIFELSAPRGRNVPLPLAQYLRSARPDVLLAAMWPLTFIAPVAARLARFQGRVVVSEHNNMTAAYSRRGRLHRQMMAITMRLAYPRVDAVIGVSEGVVEDLAHLSKQPLKAFTVIYNPASRGDDAAGGPRPAELPFSGPIILSVGTLKAQKRQDLLLTAFAQLPSELGAILCLLGDGPLRESLETQATALGIADRVIFAGFRPDTATWYAQASLFVLASDYEGFGNVIVEALEQGVPVVSTDCPSGPREILADGKYGRLVPVDDSNALAAAMQAALAEQPDRSLLRARAQDFAVDRIADQYLDVLLPGWRNGMQS